jgi:hypothetical protein
MHKKSLTYNFSCDNYIYNASSRVILFVRGFISKMQKPPVNKAKPVSLQGSPVTQSNAKSAIVNNVDSKKLSTAVGGAIHSSTNTVTQGVVKTNNKSTDNFSFKQVNTGFFMTQNFDQINNELQQHAQENIKSLLQASKTLGAAVEQITTAYFKAVQDVYSNNAKALQQILSSQNVQQAFDVQSKTLQQNIETGIGQAQAIVQLGLDAANKTIQPLQNRFDQAVDSAFKAGKKAAA